MAAWTKGLYADQPIFAESYLLANDDWKYDTVPELHEGKNFADFVDPDIAARLDALEAEEEQLAEQGFYDSDESEEGSDAEDDEAIRKTARLIRKRRASIKQDSQLRKMGKQNRIPLPRTRPAVHRTQSDVTNALKRAGYDTASLEQRAAITAQARKAMKAEKRKRAVEEEDTEMGDATFDTAPDTSMDVDMDDSAAAGPSKRTKGNTGIAARKPGKPNRHLAGLRDEAQLEEAEKKLSMARKERNRLGKAGDADRHSKSLRSQQQQVLAFADAFGFPQSASRRTSICLLENGVWAQPTTVDHWSAGIFFRFCVSWLALSGLASGDWVPLSLTFFL